MIFPEVFPKNTSSFTEVVLGSINIKSISAAFRTNSKVSIKSPLSTFTITSTPFVSILDTNLFKYSLLSRSKI